MKLTKDRRPTIYAFATRPIAKGEEICDAYSGVFSIADKEDRAIVHQRYHFQANKHFRILDSGVSNCHFRQHGMCGTKMRKYQK
jgi:hypothetical protein